MSSRKTNVPAIPVPGSVSVDKVLSAIKEATEVGFGRRGDPLDRFVTVRELGDAGVVSVSNTRGGGVSIAPTDNGTSSGNPGSTNNGDSGSPVFNPGDPNLGNTDYTVPPAPKNVKAKGIAPGTANSLQGATGGIMVTWDAPGYSNHAYTEVYAVSSAVNSNGAAVTFTQFIGLSTGFDFTVPEGGVASGHPNINPNYVGNSAGTMFMHTGINNTGAPGHTSTDALDQALNTSGFYYFVRFVSAALVPGPFQVSGSQSGAFGQLTIDPGAVLDAMIGNIRTSPLYNNLRQFFGTTTAAVQNNALIMQAGGIGNYAVNNFSQTNGKVSSLQGFVGSNTDGSSQYTNGQSVFANLTSVQATATANSVAINAVTSWQANLDTSVPGAAAAGLPLQTQWNVISWTKDATTLYLDLDSAPNGVSKGDLISLRGNSSSQLSAIYSHSLVVSDVITGGWQVRIQESTIANSNGQFFYNEGVTFVDSTLSASTGGQEFKNAMASVMDTVFVSVDPNTAIGQRINSIDLALGDFLVDTTQTVSQAIDAVQGDVDSIWSVKMQQTVGGLRYAAGFGLGMHSDSTGKSVSTFIVNANQFAIMGPTSPGAAVTAVAMAGSTATFTLAVNPSTTPGGAMFVADTSAWPNIDPTTNEPFKPDDKSTIVISVPQLDSTDPDVNTHSLDGMCGVIKSIGTSSTTNKQITVQIDPFQSPFNQSTWPLIGNRSTWTYGGTDPNASPVIVAGQSNIPFVVDTTRNVVGIRGKLVVDGLLRATKADFNELTANSAYIQALQAQIVNANVVIGQRIIAGQPGSGALAGDYNGISNYIIELNNPLNFPGAVGPTGGPQGSWPLRYWKPSAGMDSMSFGLCGDGSLFVGGNLSVGKNAVINTTSSTNPAAASNPTLVSIGGAGQDRGYAMWIGPKAGYGNTGERRTWDNGLFWVADDGSGAGFNTSLFLGDSGLMLPTLSGNQTGGSAWSAIGFPGVANPRAASAGNQSAVSSKKVTIKPLKNGGIAKTLIIVCGTFATVSGGGDHKTFCYKATLSGSPSALSYDAASPSDYTITEHTVDDFPMETWPFTMMGVVEAPAGDYYVRLNVKTIVDADLQIISGWNVIALQVN